MLYGRAIDNNHTRPESGRHRHLHATRDQSLHIVIDSDACAFARHDGASELIRNDGVSEFNRRGSASQLNSKSHDRTKTKP
eukprot:4604921-Alexandrium_andersonii.AAC.1